MQIFPPRFLDVYRLDQENTLLLARIESAMQIFPVVVHKNGRSRRGRYAGFHDAVVCRSSLEGLGSEVGYMNSEHLVFASSSQETRPARSTATFRLELASPTVLHARTDSLVSCSFSSRIFGAVTPGTPFTLLLGTRRTPHEQSVLILVCKLLATVRRIEMRWW
jgi:hypothetical protein